MTQDIAVTAAQYGVDAGALQSLIAFLRGNVERDHKLRAALIHGDERTRHRVIERGVVAWRDHSQRILSELGAHSNSEWAVEARAKLADDVWTEIRKSKGLPV